MIARRAGRRAPRRSRLDLGARPGDGPAGPTSLDVPALDRPPETSVDPGYDALRRRPRRHPRLGGAALRDLAAIGPSSTAPRSRAHRLRRCALWLGPRARALPVDH